jgi:hypothetical protein
VVAPPEGTNPNFHEAFTQLNLGQLLALVKYTNGNRRDGGIDPNADYILWNNSSPSSCVDEDLGIGGIVRHGSFNHTE